MKLGMQIVSPKPLFQLARIVLLPSAGMCEYFFNTNLISTGSDTNWRELSRITLRTIDNNFDGVILEMPDTN